VDARDLLDQAWMIPALPAFGAALLLLFGKRIGEPKAGWIATGLMALAFVASVVVFFALHSLPEEDRTDVISNGFTWIRTGNFSVAFRFLVDPLSTTMILFVTGVGTLIHLYSIGYMHGDPRYSRFFAYMNLFAASMLVLVLGSNFLVTFLGWEGVGLCSYLLISFWFERNSAAVAGKKAFITNRVGDFGFMIAMFLIFQKLGTLEYAGPQGALALAPGLTNTAATAIALLLFLGAIGKSAQFPLHIWLPDAMEGPTPVSALIHAATMVTAGVFLLCRSNAFLTASDNAADIVAWLGAFTALFAATIAIVQWDIKRVLAYSTISQLGYMFLAVGVGAYSAAMFHMITHAFFKALLFLGAGAVIHGLHDEQDMRRMGRLRKWMPITAGTFIVGWLAIAGVFPLSGFWSKDEILLSAWVSDNYALWAVGTVTALCTAFYMTRQVYLVFYGNERWSEFTAAEHEAHAEEPVGVHGAGHEDAIEPLEASVGATGIPAHSEPGPERPGAEGAKSGPHESPPSMTLPLIVLAILAAVGGIINLPFLKQELDFLARWLEPVFETAQQPHPETFAIGFVLATVALTIAVIGIVVGRAFYKNGLGANAEDPVEEKLGGFAKVLANAYYLDIGLARFVSGPVTTAANWLSNIFDRKVVDGAVNGIAGGLRDVSGGLRKLQTGLVRNYALAIVGGTLVLVAYVFTRAVGT
jgi:NADH-quinone oxidoreductase subunit L